MLDLAELTKKLSEKLFRCIKLSLVEEGKLKINDFTQTMREGINLKNLNGEKVHYSLLELLCTDQEEKTSQLFGLRSDSLLHNEKIYSVSVR